MQCGRTNEAEMQFEKLLGPLHVKSAIAELSRSERGDDGESVKYSELFYGRHFNGTNCSFIHSFTFMCFIITLLCSRSLFITNPLFCYSCFYWHNALCFTTVIGHKFCVLFLINCVQKCGRAL